GAGGGVGAEDLGEESPEGRDRVKPPVAVPDAMLVEGIVDAGLGQDVGEREAVVAHEAGAEPIQARPGVGRGVSGRGGRGHGGGEGLVVGHNLSYVGVWTKGYGAVASSVGERRGAGSVRGADGDGGRAVGHGRPDLRGGECRRIRPCACGCVPPVSPLSPEVYAGATRPNSLDLLNL